LPGLKILLFSVTVVLALINRFRLLPRYRRARSVLLDQALSFAVLAVVSVLGTWPPATHHHGG
jgi:putative copper export protein